MFESAFLGETYRSVGSLFKWLRKRQSPTFSHHDRLSLQI